MPVKNREDNWVTLSKIKNMEVFSELDVLLRALDRFFTIEDLPFSKEDISNRNFFDELATAKDAILRILGLLDVIIPESKRNVYWFQKFALAKYLNDEKRDAFREELYKQDFPEKSLLLLYDSFVNLKGIIMDILKTEYIPYLTFTSIGQMIGKDLRENSYFNPFKKDLNPEFDVIENREISRIVKSIKERETKKYISVILLYLFKFLRYLRFADISSKYGSYNAALLVVLLLRSEIALFKTRLEQISQNLLGDGLQTLVKSLSYQFSIESKRVFEQELKKTFISKPSQYPQGRIENSHGILKNLTEQSIIQIVQFFKPEISGNEVFESFLTRLEQSLRLREDLLVLEKLLIFMEEQTSDADRLRAFAVMRNFMLYFQSFTSRLLRYDDYEEFSSFFDRVHTFTPDDMHGKNLTKLMDRVKQFRIFIETCLRQLSHRSELIDRPADMDRVEASMKQYIH
ncbi:MAG: hypothetical protein ABSA46_08040 [Thermodesulfovibrionales bacterium]|jgi:hypothetical protein